MTVAPVLDTPVLVRLAGSGALLERHAVVTEAHSANERAGAPAAAAIIRVRADGGREERLRGLGLGLGCCGGVAGYRGASYGYGFGGEGRGGGTGV